jgi:hypothetical protein
MGKLLALALAGLALGTVDGRLALADGAKEQITAGPGLERATDIWAIIRWTDTSVKGTSLRYGVVRYGIDRHRLDHTATSPNRWNPGLSYMIYRVQVNHLRPDTTYYYRVGSENAAGISEGAQSAVDKFTTEPAP